MLLEICTVIALFLCFRKWRKRPKGFPPGPFSWPLVGNLAHVGIEPYKTVMTMREKYGDIIGLDLGPTRVVFINEYKLVKEAFNMPIFCGRPIMHHMAEPEDEIFGGILFTSEKNWVEQRRFTFSYIQSGFRNGVPVEKLLSEESEELIAYLNKYCGQPISSATLFNLSALNSIWTVVSGGRFCIQDKKYLKLVDHVDQIASSPATLGILVFFPGLSKLMPKLTGFDKCNANMEALYKYAQEVIDAHVDSYQEGVERDFVDGYLKKIQSTTDTQSSFFDKTGIKNLRHTLVDLILGGIETVASTLRWMLFLTAQFPDVQDKLRRTIVNHIKHCGEIALKDRPKLPYIEALILEVTRYSSIMALGVLHETTDDVEFHGYFIPKGTAVVANQFGINHDPSVWGDPENIRPERFLTADESEVIRHPALIPFSAGKRACPGEALARDQLFIFTVHLFSNFEIGFDPSEPTPQLKHEINTALSPPKHKIILQPVSMGRTEEM